MEKKNKLLKSIFLVGIVLSFGIQLFYIYQVELQLSLLKRIILFLIQMISIIGYVHFDLYHKTSQTQKEELKKAHWIVFIIYCLNLIYILFLDPNFGRQFTNESLSFQEYLQYNVNLDLFESIQLFVRGYQMGVVSLEALLRNILGNMCIFMPMAYFLPSLFEKQRKFICFFITLFLLVLGVEIFQVLLRSGSGDIDDLFLNVVGGVSMFLILKKCLFQARKERK